MHSTNHNTAKIGKLFSKRSLDENQENEILKTKMLKSVTNLIRSQGAALEN